VLATGVAVAETHEFTYVTNSAENTVSVIDTATNTVLTTIPVGLSPAGVAVSTGGTRALRAAPPS
jgi:YVTN family beta-propeller protein